MNTKTNKYIYVILFSILYIATAFISMTHAVAFFSLANVYWMGIILAITFEIGQAAVLFSILTNKSQQTKFLPWCLMTVLTFVQILGNVFSSYKYILTNSINDLKYFKEPIFVWTDLPDNITTVIVTYLLGAILPVICLLLTSMVTNYLEDTNKVKDGQVNDNVEEKQIENDTQVEEIKDEEKPFEPESTILGNSGKTTLDENINQMPNEIKENFDDELVEEKQLPKEKPNDVEIEEVKQDVPIQKKSHFINI